MPTYKEEEEISEDMFKELDVGALSIGLVRRDDSMMAHLVHEVLTEQNYRASANTKPTQPINQ